MYCTKHSQNADYTTRQVKDITSKLEHVEKTVSLKYILHDIYLVSSSEAPILDAFC